MGKTSIRVFVLSYFTSEQGRQLFAGLFLDNAQKNAVGVEISPAAHFYRIDSGWERIFKGGQGSPSRFSTVQLDDGA